MIPTQTPYFVHFCVHKSQSLIHQVNDSYPTTHEDFLDFIDKSQSLIHQVNDSYVAEPIFKALENKGRNPLFIRSMIPTNMSLSNSLTFSMSQSLIHQVNDSYDAIIVMDQLLAEKSQSLIHQVNDSY